MKDVDKTTFNFILAGMQWCSAECSFCSFVQFGLYGQTFLLLSITFMVPIEVDLYMQQCAYLSMIMHELQLPKDLYSNFVVAANRGQKSSFILIISMVNVKNFTVYNCFRSMQDGGVTDQREQQRPPLINNRNQLTSLHTRSKME